MGTIHCGKKIKPGGRYCRLLAALKAAGLAGLTTRDITVQANICAVSTTVSELRKMGYAITCEPDGKSQDGASIYRYWLVG